MAMKVRPVTRQQLLELAVTDVDAFMAHRYLRHREAVPALLDLEEKGSKTLPGVEGALNDLNHALWSPEPGVKEEVTPDRRYWRELLGQTMKSTAYEELHATTQLKELQSVLGTIAMGESVLAMVSKEDQEKLQELNGAQQQANQAGQQAQEAQATANAIQQLAQAAAQATKNTSDGGRVEGEDSSEVKGQAGGMTSEQAKAIANQLAEQASQAQTEAQAAQMSFEQAKALANELAEKLMGKPGSEEAQKRSEQLRRMGMAAAKQAQANVEEISDIIQAWGLEPGELTLKDLEEILWILKEVKTDPKLQKLVKQLGRYWRSSGKGRSRVPREGVRIAITETGRDLKRAVPAELIALTHPALRVKAQMRWARGELRLRGQKTRQKFEKGPVIVAEDKSGSMGEGDKGDWANWLVYRVAQIAQKERRTFGWILFDRIVQKSKVFPRGVISLKERVEIARTQASGGTDFESPLRRAVEMIQKEGLKKADILLVTDGMCAISDAFLKELLAVKKALEVKIFTVLVNVGETTDATVKEFSDRIVPISDLTADEAERKVIGIL